MDSASRTFRLARTAAARLSFVLGLGLTGAATLAAAPSLYAQQSARTDLVIQSDVLKALNSYPDLSGEHITATTRDGIVTLGGTASSDTTKNQAQVVAATVDGVRSVVNNVTVTGGGASAPASEDPADRNNAPDVAAETQPVQAQSTDPNHQQVPYSPQQQPQPGSTGNWGQAGPPPDAQNGAIPPPPQENQQSGQSANQYPMQDPGDDNNAPPPQQPQSQQPRPAYGPPAGQYPPPAQQGYPQYQQPYGQSRPYVAPHLASTPLTLQPGTLFSIRTSEPLDSRKLRGGENFQAVLAQDLYQGQYLAIPRGAVLQGHVVGVKKPGAVRGDAGFALQITSLSLGGQNYPVATDTFATDTRGKGGYTAANTVGGAAIGALIGAVAGGGPGAAIGAVAGGGVGLGASAASGGPRSVMPPETLLTFHLKEPLTVSPISMAEVQQLQASVRPPQPVRRPRPPYPYGYYPYPPPPPPPPGYYYPYRYWR